MTIKDKFKMSKKTRKIVIGLSAGFLVLAGGFFWWQQKSSSQAEVDTSYKTASVTEGSITSSTLLTGTVKAYKEQYVYFDSGKGTNASVTVSVGDQITAGQQLVQYDATSAQAAYDTAVRNLNKIGRQINYLKTYGNLPTTTTSTDEETGETTTVTEQPSAQSKAQYNQQLQDLNDSYSDAQAEVNKAQVVLNETIVVSDIEGTVVEVNPTVDPSSKNSQTLVHVATEGQLQIHGSLTEYDLANIKTGQAVTFKSKVYPDKEFNGIISYISNYPKEASESTSSSNSSNNASTYDYKVDLRGDISGLKQGFTVSVEVVNENKYKLVPVTALVSEQDKNYVWLYDDNTGKVIKREVKIGNADAKKQEIIDGLEPGQFVISNPNDSLKDGAKLDNVTSDSDEGEVTDK